MNTRIIAIIAISTLIFITASATYFAATQNQIPIYKPVRFWEQLWGSAYPIGGTAMAMPNNFNFTTDTKPLPDSFNVR